MLKILVTALISLSFTHSVLASESVGVNQGVFNIVKLKLWTEGINSPEVANKGIKLSKSKHLPVEVSVPLEKLESKLN